jgi:hypothetical protein
MLAASDATPRGGEYLDGSQVRRRASVRPKMSAYAVFSIFDMGWHAACIPSKIIAYGQL